MDKEEIKKQLQKEIEENINGFVDAVAGELSKEKFNMSNVENAIGNSINDYQKEIMNTTEKLFNLKPETELVSKKKQNGKKKDIS